MEGKIIAVIGGPGTGKSFLVEKLAEKLNAVKIIEDVNEIPSEIIEHFKNDTGAVEILLWFRNKCIKDMEKALELKNHGKTVVMDTYWISNELHITTMVSGFIQKVLMEQAKIDREYLPKPDKVILLDASEEKIKQMTLERGRDFDINEEFLQRNISIRNAHRRHYNENKEEYIYVNRDDLDFEKEEDLNEVIEMIKSKIV
ncbi:MAG: AAA family ATPase [Nanoarchaeota archaeon]